MNYKRLLNLENKLRPNFDEIDRVALLNQQKILQAFLLHNVRQSHFAPSSGYAYDDQGRQTLNNLYASVFGFDCAIVSHCLFSGTHTIFTALRGLLRPNDNILSITGEFYDSVKNVISGKIGALSEYNIGYKCIDLQIDGTFDTEQILQQLEKQHFKVVYIQRAGGYSNRRALLPTQIEECATLIKSKYKNIIIVVDNCYGEFVCQTEPQKNIDVLIGSLIKNPGGGIVQCGGYIVCNKNLQDRLAAAVVAPGIGLEIGANLLGYRDSFLGLFMASHTVAQAKKSALLFGLGFKDLGFETSINLKSQQADIVVSIELKNEQNIKLFSKLVQNISPVDSFVTPTAWDMPGYDSQIIMSAGTFTQGSTIELSADAPIRPPYTVYLQGALNYEHAKIAFDYIADQFEK